MKRVNLDSVSAGVEFVSRYFKRRLVGYIDTFTGKTVTGWIKEQASDGPVIVDLYLNGVRVAQSVVANTARPDLRDAGYGNGGYGFEISVPSIQDAHDKVTVSVHLAGQKRAAITREYRPSHQSSVADHDLAREDAAEETVISTLPDTKLRGKDRFTCKIDLLTPEEVSGWAVNSAHPEQTFNVEILIDGIFFNTVSNNQPRNDLKQKGISEGLGGIRCALPFSYFDEGKYQVSIRMPDGSIQKNALDISNPRRSVKYSGLATLEKPLTVIVPIYNAFDDLVVCINKLQKYTPGNVDVILIDDCSPDPRIARALESVADVRNVRVLRNSQNLGFTHTVNLGIAEAGRNNVIILNSDARVTPGWIDGMRLAASSGPRIATVTAMSDRAGAFSAPSIGNENLLPVGVEEASYARAFRRRSLGLYPMVPTGNGFCMYISRDCIDEIGSLDAQAFPRGYGEENDFCMRARLAGWRNIIDDRTYVFHERSKSFGSAKTELMAAGRAVVDSRYPDYKQAIQIFSTSEKIALARYQARRALQDCIDEGSDRQRVLYVTSTQTGGTPQTNRDLMRALADSTDCWNLRCDSRVLELSRLVGNEVQLVCRHTLEEPVDPLTHQSAEYDTVVTNWIVNFDFDLVHIRHVAWHSLSLPSLVKRLGRKVIFSFHDFYALSPTIKLIDDTGTFRGETFRLGGSKYRESLWPIGSQPEPTGVWADTWRERFEKELLVCDAFVTTSNSARALIIRGMPSLPVDRFVVIPHGRDFTAFHNYRELPVHGKPLRILVPGNINPAKGLDIISALSEIDKEKLLEFHILGNINQSNLANGSRIVNHGKYERNDFLNKVKVIQPHIGAIFSIWDETYCHTLTELWAAGLPAVVFDFPTVATRVREAGAGWVLDHLDIPQLYERIIKLGFDKDQQRMADAAVSDWQRGLGAGNTTRVMAAQYLGVYRDVLRENNKVPGQGTAAKIGVVCPGNGNLAQASASTYIRIWERTRNSIDRDVTYIRMTPECLLANASTGGVDGAIIQRTAIPRTMVDELLNAFDRNGIRYMVDLDDDLFDVPEAKDPQGTYAAYAPSLGRLLSKAKLVTVSTAPLRKSVNSYNRNVVVIPNSLSGRLWRTPPIPRLPDGAIRALYMGTPTHHDDLMMIMAALEATAASHPDFRLTIIGGTKENILHPERLPWLSHIVVPPDRKEYDVFVPWLRQQAGRCDFAIAPLQDIKFNDGKSPLKVLDYAALGLPILASDVSVYEEVSQSVPEINLVGNTIAKWKAALNRQVLASSRSNDRGELNRNWVLSNNFIENTFHEFDRLVLSHLLDLGEGHHKFD
ncbi:glycosyltransferase [Agrobacterium tumefaciens]|uniref:Glycosyltransferase n=1 Tax=Agrobacterium tumefaciens TaxID=358 RepID=A0AA44J831_AGRTU|nr:glycosyltransferase [Agrobacterium tumefaciens]NSL24027.1 glycosyltransferase [Agrobacterium tumefaciens]NTB87990.1 glycosyltransferase [Agrobacterium tumefaciens]NTC16246.1 glycosyltransferase [Agrobacterium tumefaciens]NTC27806.1 glycosyltransferase [Agrobacterium tumefaciens]NTC55636.1 glycosyltransferase [Agrobacterium tumefaciens]